MAAAHFEYLEKNGDNGVSFCLQIEPIGILMTVWIAT